MDFAYVDSVTVAGESYDAIVIGDPCSEEELINNEGRLDVSFVDPFGSGETIRNLADVAPELACECPAGGCRLSNATFSDGGYPVIGLFFDAAEGEEFNLEDDCAIREQQGYASGMGLIFRKAAEISPIQAS
jgi:hypothetical protein